MKNKIWFSVTATAFLAGVFAMAMPAATVRADQDADYQRKIDQQISELNTRINETKERRKDDPDADRKIKDYQERIAQIKRDAAAKKGDKGLGDRVREIRKEFYEWRFKSSIDSYKRKIVDLKQRNSAQTDADKKREMNEKIDKLEAKNGAVEAKLADLKATSGDNWDTIQHDLDAKLQDIDRYYDELEARR